MKTIAPHNICTGCMACVDTCKKNAINIIEKGGISYPYIDTEKCIDCGLCKKICPSLVPAKRVEEAEVFAAYSTNDDIRINAASGGFCTQMSIETIKRGGYVATVIMKNNRAEYILTNRIEDVLQGANSKYVQVKPVGIYKKVKEVLITGTEVLFVGLPCFCAALKNYLLKDYENLTTIELICSAPPSPYAIDLELQHSGADEFLQFRKKYNEHMWGENDYNIVVKDSSNIKTLTQKETVFYKIFASLITARKSCTDCKYAQLKRVADYTVGDFHGYTCHNKEQGISVVIANKKKALQQSKPLELHLIPETWNKAVICNHRLYNGYDFLRFHPAVVFRNKLYGSNIFKKFCLNKHQYKLLWGMYKIWTKIIMQFKKKQALRQAATLDKK